VNGGTLNIIGGEISWNTSVGTGGSAYAMGCGVCAKPNSAIIMSAGAISHNLIVANRDSGGATGGWSGGVCLYTEGADPINFDFSGGSISDNFIGGVSKGSIMGCGVALWGDSSGLVTFTMRGTAKITGNRLYYPNSAKYVTRSMGGSGVYMGKGCVFNMQAGEISGNSVEAHGRFALGAVEGDIGTFNMSGGIITGNTATSEKVVATKGLFIIKTLTTVISGSASIPDGITLSTAYNDDTYPKLNIPGPLTNSFTLTLQNGTTATDSSFNSGTYDWAGDKVILTGAGAVAAIPKFTLGYFTKNSSEGESAAPTAVPIGNTGKANSYELTQSGSDVKLTAK
jgi:hypothetical protein